MLWFLVLGSQGTSYLLWSSGATPRGESPQLNRLRLDNYYANAPGPEVPTCGDREEKGSAKARRARGLQGKCFFIWGNGTTPNCLRVLPRKRESEIEKQSPRRMPSITRNGDPAPPKNIINPNDKCVDVITNETKDLNNETRNKTTTALK